MSQIITDIEKIVADLREAASKIKTLQEYTDYWRDMYNKVYEDNQDLRAHNTKLATELFELKIRINQYKEDSGKNPEENCCGRHQ